MALSDGPILDAQAGAETFGSALIAALAGVNSVSGPGMLDFLLVFSLPKLVFDNEMCGQALRFVREIKPLDDLPVDALIDQLMADQHLIMAEHTMAHWPNELYLPSAIVERDNRENWTKAGAKDTYQRAIEEVEHRLAAYRPLETDPAIDAELRQDHRIGPGVADRAAVHPAGRRAHRRGACPSGRARAPSERPPRRLTRDANRCVGGRRHRGGGHGHRIVVGSIGLDAAGADRTRRTIRPTPRGDPGGRGDAGRARRGSRDARGVQRSGPASPEAARRPAACWR